jgi:hypothetical protein
MERPCWALRFLCAFLSRAGLVDVQVQPFRHGVEKPPGASLVQVLIEMDAKCALVPMVALVFFGRVYDAAVKSLASHQFLNELVARVER